MKIGIHLLGGDFASEANPRGAALEKNELRSETTITIIGDQECILSGLSLLNENPLGFQ